LRTGTGCLVASALLALSLTMCGGAAVQRAPEAPASSAPAPADAPAGAGAYPTATPATPQPSQPPAGAPPATMAPPAENAAGSGRDAARSEFARAQSDLEAASTDCVAACRALASMERAAQHLCDLAGDPDDQNRCNDARRKVVAARERIRSACGTCP
jgi:hypothetical protein